MRRVALKQPRPNRPVASPMKWTSPVQGWRTDVPIGDMPPTAAAYLSNFFPEPGYIRARNGSQNWATGLPGIVNTIMPYSGSVGKLFAASGEECELLNYLTNMTKYAILPTKGPPLCPSS